MSMKRRFQTAVLPQLPEDIIFFEIFARLPIRSLLKFQLVSRFCRSLTSDPQFVAARRRHSPPCYLISYANWLLQSHSVNYISPTNSETKAVQCFKNDRYDSYAKSINGLMCMIQGEHIVIRNLVTNEEFKLPYFHGLSELHKHYVYFCYCPKEDKYKVLISTSRRIRNSYDVSIRYSIFTLGVDQQWRVSHHPEFFQIGKSKTICIDGVLYFTNFLTSNVVNSGVIATFDVQRETFGFITYPKELSSSKYTICHLIEVNGVIAMVDFECDAIRIWIREKKLRWIEIRVLLPLGWVNICNVGSNFSFTTNRRGEIVLAYCGKWTTKCWLFVYNMERKEWRRIEAFGLERDQILGDFLIEEYVETHLLKGQVQGQGSIF